MYTIIFILFAVNLFFLTKYGLLSVFFNLNDKKTKVPLLGGPFVYFNFILICIFFIHDSENFFFDNYFKQFFIDQSSISYREILVFFSLPSLFFIIGVYDDKFNIHANYRILVSFFIIFIFLLIDENFIIRSIRLSEDIEFHLYGLSTIFTIICMTGLIFAFNMYDGINLQFGFHLLIIFTFFIFEGILVNFFIFFNTIILLFLYLNLKNKIYMGDSGVYFLGALVSIIFLKNYNIEVLKVEEIIVISLIPILDMFRVIGVRVFIRSHPFKKDHLHLHYILKKKYKKKYLWHIGSFLTLFNILLLKTVNQIYIVLFLSIVIYLLMIVYLSLNKKK
tara:strand:+ start:139 stop:1143 length:1005 start_codon:yes stop_codon:yes gene_type:complete